MIWMRDDGIDTINLNDLHRFVESQFISCVNLWWTFKIELSSRFSYYFSFDSTMAEAALHILKSNRVRYIRINNEFRESHADRCGFVRLEIIVWLTPCVRHNYFHSFFILLSLHATRLPAARPRRTVVKKTQSGIQSRQRILRSTQSRCWIN